MIEWDTAVERLRTIHANSSWETIAKAIDEAHGVVERTFDREEEGGYLREVARVSPERDRARQRLKSQHRELLGRLVNIREWTQKRLELDRVLLKIEAWLKDLEQHEQKERALLQETFTVDLGTGH